MKLSLVSALVGLFVASSAMAHGDEDHSHDKPAAPIKAPVGERPQRLADGTLVLPVSLQKQWGVRTFEAWNADIAVTVELNGKVVPHPNASGRIQATQSGSVLPGVKGWPMPGRKVKKGEVLAMLRPANGVIEHGNQQAQRVELESQLAIAEARMKRLEQLEGLVPQKEIEAARIEQVALQKRLGFVAASINTALPLAAPVSGIISASYVVAGQVVDGKELLFEIVDPERLAVEALAYDVSLVSTISGASAWAADLPLDLKFMGGGRQLREQALPLLFGITSRNALVAVGQPVKLIVRTTRRTRGVTLSRQAVTKTSTGDAMVWVRVGADRFVARRVKVKPLDAANVAVTEGLKDEEQVVVEGANLLSQVRS